MLILILISLGMLLSLSFVFFLYGGLLNLLPHHLEYDGNIADRSLNSTNYFKVFYRTLSGVSTDISSKISISISGILI